MKKDCIYMKKCYRDGSLLKETGESLLCKDGVWEKKDDRPDSTIAPGKDMSDI
jgi:hypothetical protein